MKLVNVYMNGAELFRNAHSERTTVFESTPKLVFMAIAAFLGHEKIDFGAYLKIGIV